MNRSIRTQFLSLLLLLVSGISLSACSAPDSTSPSHSNSDVESEAPKGPHGGRLLSEGEFAVEVVIFETGVPPEFHLYAYRNGEPLPPDQLSAQLELHRLGDGVDRFSFAPARDHLQGDGVVTEPHSFDVKVRARFDGKDYAWEYESHEGRTTIAPRIAEAAGIAVESVGPGLVEVTETLRGRIVAQPGSVRMVRPRFPGLIRKLNVTLGESVRSGQQLAVIESDESLRTYSVSSPVAGVVTAIHRYSGEPVGTETLLEIRQAGAVAAELQVFPGQRDRIQEGQAVRLRTDSSGTVLEGQIERLLPVLDVASQSQTARVAVDGTDTSNWLPGMFVTAEVVVDTIQAPLVVRERALQSFRDFTVVYAQVGDTYEVRMLELGARDGEFVEVLGGIRPGTRYVVDNSYLIKADVEKSGASHDH